MLIKGELMNIKFILLTVGLFGMSAANAEGPIGFGSIKLGVSKEAIEAIKSEEGIYLTAPMSPYQYKNSTPTPGQNRFDTRVSSPFSRESFKAVLTFDDTKLINIYLDLTKSEFVFDSVKKAITEKYGDAKTENTMKEEQCIYKNGNNFKVSTGAISHKWSEQNTLLGKVDTSLTNFNLDACPENLRYAVPGVKLFSLNIGMSVSKENNKDKAMINAF